MRSAPNARTESTLFASGTSAARVAARSIPERARLARGRAGSTASATARRNSRSTGANAPGSTNLPPRRGRITWCANAHERSSTELASSKPGCEAHKEASVSAFEHVSSVPSRAPSRDTSSPLDDVPVFALRRRKTRPATFGSSSATSRRSSTRCAPPSARYAHPAAAAAPSVAEHSTYPRAGISPRAACGVSPRKRWCTCKPHRTGEMRIERRRASSSSRSVRVESAARSRSGVPKSRRLMTVGHARTRCIERKKTNAASCGGLL